MSQSIRSDHISESTIARIAGNLLSGYVEVDAVRRQEAVVRAVAQARAIAAEVQRTHPAAVPPPPPERTGEHEDTLARVEPGATMPSTGSTAKISARG